MSDFSLSEAQQFQDRTIERVREIERNLDRDVITYYVNDKVDDESDARENLDGLRRYLRAAYQQIDVLLTDIERRLG